MHSLLPSRSDWLRGILASAAVVPSVQNIASAQAATIRVGSSPLESNAQPYYAADMDFFKKAGLPVEVSVLSNGSAIAAAVVGGSLDIGTASTLVFMNALRHGIPLTAIAAGSLYTTTEATTLLVVPAASPIRTAKELNGKIVGGLTVGGMDQLAIMSWIDENGGDSSTVKVVEISPSSMVDALEQGRITAALLPDPQLSAAGSRVRSVGKAYDAIAKTFMAGVWYCTTDFATKNPAAIKQFATAMAQAGVWAEANPERAAAILEKWTKTKVPRIRTHYTQRFDAALLQPICDRAYKYKMIETPMDAKTFIWAPKA